MEYPRISVYPVNNKSHFWCERSFYHMVYFTHTHTHKISTPITYFPRVIFLFSFLLPKQEKKKRKKRVTDFLISIGNRSENGDIDLFISCVIFCSLVFIFSSRTPPLSNISSLLRLVRSLSLHFNFSIFFTKIRVFK